MKQKKFELDLSISERERNQALKNFVMQTGFDANAECDEKTINHLKEMRQQETESELLKLRDKYKRMREAREKKKVLEDEKRQFIKQIEDTAIYATQVQSLTQ